MRLFADDSGVYREISSVQDQEALQADVTRIFEWAKDWDMTFNVTKCCHVSITRKTTRKLQTSYAVDGQTIPATNSCKYLGVEITSDLSWNAQTNSVYSKAARTLGMLRRNLGPCSPEVKTRAYEALVRPQLEYGTAAWNPHTQRNISMLESIQRQAARFVSRDYRKTSSPTAMIDGIGWQSLEQRRRMAQATMFYRIHHQLVNIQFPNTIHRKTRQTRNSNSLQYTQIQNRVDSYKYSMFPWTIPLWNQLPNAAVTAETVVGFDKAAWPTIKAVVPVGASTA